MTDVNGDGKLDIVTANASESSSVSILSGRGDGTFGPQKTISVGGYPVSMALSDFNGDHRPDLALNIGDYGSEGVDILLNQGGGTFGPPKKFKTATYPISMAVADINGDHKLDIVTLHYPNRLTILFGDGNGAFSGRESITAGKRPCSSLSVCDLNGDSIADIAVGNSSTSTVSVLLGKGKGGFQPPISFNVEDKSACIAAADVNGDGILDLISGDAIKNTISILRGKGDGTFRPYQTFQVSTFPSSITVTDANNDGKADILVIPSSSYVVNMLFGDGKGSFTLHNVNVGDFTTSVAIADVNADGKPDLISTSGSYPTGAGIASVLLGTGKGSFETQQQVDTGSDIPFSACLADINGDHLLDLVSGGGEFYPYISVCFGNGHGAFATAILTDLDVAPASLVVQDLNGDGSGDIVMAHGSYGDVGVLLGNGDGTFQPELTYALGATPGSVDVTDVNHDGKLDIVTANDNDDGSGTISVLLGNGDGTFNAHQGFTTHTTPTDVTIADINGDTFPDVLTADDYGMASVLLGNGNGTFQAYHDIDVVGFAVEQVAVTDLNADGHPDLLTANAGSRNVSVLLGNGDGSFRKPKVFPTGSGTGKIAVVDMNGDGLSDIVAANNGSHTISVLLGKGDGTFQPQQVFTLEGSPGCLAVGDLDGDGLPDIVASNESGRMFNVLLNRTLRASLDSGVLTVTGTAGNDSLTLRRSGNSLQVKKGTSTASFAYNSISQIKILSGDGNDIVTIGAGIIGAYIDGGIGNDSLIGGTGNDSLLGSGGNDSLVGNAGDDFISGGLGRDSMWGGDGNDRLISLDSIKETVDGGLGTDSVTADVLDQLIGIEKQV